MKLTKLKYQINNNLVTFSIGILLILWYVVVQEIVFIHIMNNSYSELLHVFGWNTTKPRYYILISSISNSSFLHLTKNVFGLLVAGFLIERLVKRKEYLIYLIFFTLCSIAFYILVIFEVENNIYIIGTSGITTPMVGGALYLSILGLKRTNYNNIIYFIYPFSIFGYIISEIVMFYAESNTPHTMNSLIHIIGIIVGFIGVLILHNVIFNKGEKQNNK